MRRQYTVLIVDDSEINRKILFKILKNEYLVLQAENGRQALDILNSRNGIVSAVLLDLVMPIMDGYAFLSELKTTSDYGLPIIVTTGNNEKENEKKAFDLGAWDFILKPYDAQILKYRLQSAISRSESVTLEKMKHMAEHDSLTDLHNRNKFFEETEKMIRRYPSVSFAFVRLDVDRFSLINTFFGNDEGDRMLCFVSIKSILNCLDTAIFQATRSDGNRFCSPSTDRQYGRQFMKQSKVRMLVAVFT